MKIHLPLFSALALLTLAGCASATGQSPSAATLEQRLRNPLYAEQYWSDMAEHMADFIRADDKSVERAIVDYERIAALEKVAAVRETMKEGKKGSFLIATDHIQGQALLLKNSLYFGVTFLSYPNPDPRVYLTTIVDPRDTTFPDVTSYEVGSLLSPFGEQEYTIPLERMDARFRTVVLYDKKLNRILGFAQL